jgi:formylmethanofuran dehydrogenase subunit E
MSSKAKKLAKQIEQATKQTVSKKKGKKHASLIEKYAKKLAKKLFKVKEAKVVPEVQEIIEKNVEPTVWNAKVPETAAVETDK